MRSKNPSQKASGIGLENLRYGASVAVVLILTKEIRASLRRLLRSSWGGLGNAKAISR
jgi:hypothetical protein